MELENALAEYQAMRAVGNTINFALCNLVTDEEVDDAARRLGLLENGRVLANSDVEINALMDFTVHNVRRSDGTNAIDRYLLEYHPAEGSIERRALKSLQTSHFATIEVVSTEPGFGMHCHESPANNRIFVMDVAFSNSSEPGMALVGRLQCPDTWWWMTTGAGLPFTTDAREALEKAMDKYVQAHRVKARGVDLVAMTIRACIESGASQLIRYQTTTPKSRDSEDPMELTAPIRTAPKVGRNDPCPCGSGKKYKKCCGG